MDTDGTSSIGRRATMKVIEMREIAGFATLGLLGLAAAASAEERPAPPPRATAQFESTNWSEEPRRWNASFIFGSTSFYEGESHRTLGATFRVRLTNRLSVEPEVRYLSVPTYESSHGVWKHSDLLIAGHVVYDLREDTRARIVPYVAGGAGWIRVRSESTRYPIQVESRIPVFPTPSPARSTTTKTITNRLWVGGAFGVRVNLPHGFFVSPELRVGGHRDGELMASAVIKMGYGF
jgi:hypothetical protein